jgi:hypothetical protein
MLTLMPVSASKVGAYWWNICDWVLVWVKRVIGSGAGVEVGVAGGTGVGEGAGVDGAHLATATPAAVRALMRRKSRRLSFFPFISYLLDFVQISE